MQNPEDHIINCYCITNPTEIQESLEANFIYPNIPFTNFYTFAGWKKNYLTKNTQEINTKIKQGISLTSR